ncbi:class I SAM-dependent methyltransferase [Zavarzinia sp.]|uniref:class I SAM-dependent methyltransferase n=1 Tax=Zavarzinia sp. TaxID=2027920 RepID=UPI0035626717
MSKSLDWTTVSDDPNNREAKAAVRAWLKAVQRIHVDCELMDYVEAMARGRRVLDIGMAAHAMRYVDQPQWRHGRIARAASHCLGIDILESLTAELGKRGFNVRCVDATSDIDLGERFDVIFAGDVVEHVDNVVRLLQFAARHLAPGGRLYVATPNPFSRKFFRQLKRDGVMVVNLDHIAWITPTQAMELARRAGIALAAYHLIKPISGISLAIKRTFGWRLEPAEFSFPDYLYEFVRPD